MSRENQQDADEERETRVNRRTFLKGAGVLAATAAAPGTASAATGEHSDKLSPYIIQHASFGGEFSPDTDAISYGSNGNPGWIVTYQDDSYSSFESWLDGSPDRTVLRHTPGKNRVMVTAPAEHLGVSWLDRYQGNGLHAKTYIESIDINRTFTRPEPVTLDDNSAWEAPNGAKFADWTLGSGSFSATGLAFSDDAEQATMSEIRTLTGASDVSVTGAGITVAIVDTGINVADNDEVFEGRVNHAYNAVDDVESDAANGDYSAIADGDGHGTFCAAQVAGNPTDSAYVGMAPDAELAGVKVLGDDGSGDTESIVRGIEWAAETAQADIISMSLGSAYYSPAIESAIQDVLETTDVSAIVVAVGNSRMTTRWIASPADTDGVISVAATNYADPETTKSAYFSCVGPDDGWSDMSDGQTRGSKPTLGTVGMKIQTLVPTTSGGTKTQTQSGTSMATPDEAGALALLFGLVPELLGDHVAVQERVKRTTVPAPNCGVTEVGNGVLDVQALLDDEEPSESQENARTADAMSRDRANRTITASWLDYAGIDQRGR